MQDDELFRLPYTPRQRILEQPTFGCWLDNYIRVYSGHTIAGYARAIGETETFVISVIAGHTDPCQRMLDDMGYEEEVTVKKRYIAKGYIDEQY